MKLIVFLVFGGITGLPLLSQCISDDLIISQYLEGSSNNKCLEVFNGTGSNIYLDDSSYSIQFYFNGNNTPGASIVLIGGFIQNAGVWVICDEDATFFNIPNQVSNVSFFNGDDAIALLKDGIIIDFFGQIGTDPGTEWGNGDCGTQNATLLRNIYSLGNCPVDNNPLDSFDPGTWASECLPQDDITDLGFPQPPLGVELLSFDIQSRERDRILSWVTTIEINTDRFETEYSRDGTAFFKFGELQAKGHSNHGASYSLNHENVSHRHMYYRIKSIDKDKSFSYSDIISAEGMSALNGYRIYPTLVDLSLNIEFNDHLEGALIYISNIYGKIEFEDSIFGNLGFVAVDMSGFHAGLYVVTLQKGQQIYSNLVVKK
jgi:hypothetical protein